MTAKDNQVAIFGTYKQSGLYSRNQVLISSLKQLGWKVNEYQSGLQHNETVYKHSGSFSLLRTALNELVNTLSLFRYLFRIRKEKIVLVLYPTIFNIYLVKLMMLGKKHVLVADIFISLVDTIFDDRQLLKTSIIKKLLFYIEQKSFQLSDALLIDTDSHKKSVCDYYHLNSKEVHSIPVGIDETTWKPAPQKVPFENRLKVIYWGTYIPLHGLENVINAIAKLKNKEALFDFTFVGTGQCYEDIHSMIVSNEIKNINLINEILAPIQLYDLAVQHHLALGIFGTSTKASNVVPYKVTQALAANLPILTRYSTSYSHLSDENSIYYVHQCTPDEIAEKLLLIYHQFNESITPIDSHNIYEKYFSNAMITRKIDRVFSNLHSESI